MGGTLHDGVIVWETLDTTSLNNYLGGGGTSEESTGPRVGFLNVDPSNTGVEAPLGSFISRYTAGGVSLYLKTGAANTAWSQVSGANTGLVYAMTAAGAVTGSNAGAAAVLGSATYTFPANTLRVGTVIKFHLGGAVVADGQAGNIRVAIRFGGDGTAAGAGSGEPIADTGDIAINATDPFVLSGQVTVRSTGNPGVFTGGGFAALGAALTGTPVLDAEDAGAFNTLIDRFVVATVECSAAPAGNTARADWFTVEILPPAA